jgi:hypothetical protein
MCGCCETLESGERVRYFSRQLLTAEDMRTEQEYFMARMRRHNRFLHGFGVVCGFDVRKKTDGTLAVDVFPGYALSPCGNEVWLQKCVTLDLKSCLTGSQDPCTPCSASTVPDDSTVMERFIAIRHKECPTRPARTLPAGCGCDETACEYSRVRDGFDIQCLYTLPQSHVTKQPDDSRRVPVCGDCPSDDWIVLAKVSYSKDTAASTVVWQLDLVETSTYPYLVTTP